MRTGKTDGDTNGNLSQRLRRWAEENDWYRVEVMTNELKLETMFGGLITVLARQLDYHGRGKDQRHLYDCWDLLKAKCGQIDKACREGCRTQEELRELEFLRGKAVGLAAELAEVVRVVQDEPTVHVPPPAQGRKAEEWLTYSEAAEILVVSKPTICRWVRVGKLESNGKEGADKKISKTSVLILKQEVEEQQIRQDVQDLRRDAKRYS